MDSTRTIPRTSRSLLAANKRISTPPNEVPTRMKGGRRSQASSSALSPRYTTRLSRGPVGGSLSPRPALSYQKTLDRFAIWLTIAPHLEVAMFVGGLLGGRIALKLN